MDPLSAISLAGNIVQFVEFGVKLLSGAHDLYRSPTGTLAVNDQIELTTNDLNVLITKLRSSFYSDSPPDGVNKDNEVQRDLFRRICDEAAEVAKELMMRLNKFKLGDGQHRKFRSIQHIVLTVWKEKEKTDLLKRLESFKQALETRVLFSIKDKLDSQAIFTSARFDSLDIQTQRIATSLLESRDNTTKAISEELRHELNAQTMTLTQLISRLESVNQDNHRQTRDIMLRGYHAEQSRRGNSAGHIDMPRDPSEYEEITSDIEMLDVSMNAEQNLRGLVADKIIHSLKFPSMSDRYENVLEAYPETFKWALSEKQPYRDLADWFRGGAGVFWISGKAGSGKSTLMKHIIDEGQASLLLRTWAGAVPLCISTFFFWNSGLGEQRSQTGLLRALLFQVLSQYPDLVPIIAPSVWASFYSKAILNKELDYTWTLKQLLKCFRVLAKQEMIALRICFLVDGLDEFDGDYEEIAALFNEVASSHDIKVCLSSRPWVVFDEVFQGHSMLQLHDLTHGDIKHYVTDKMTRKNAFRRLEEEEPAEAQALIQEIVEKAKGVFVWVKLVVQSLLTGLRNQDEISDLWERLRLLPEEMELLYSRLLQLVEPIYLPWFSMALQLVHNTQELSVDPFRTSCKLGPGVKPLSISAFLLAMNQNTDLIKLYDTHEARFLTKCKRLKVQLKARCAGFLELSKTEADTVTGEDFHIQYFHRTARDFLETKASCSVLLSHTASTRFQVNISLMKSCIGSLEIVLARLRRIDGCSFMGHEEVIINGIVKDFMIYAYHAEANREDQQTRIELVDHVSSFMAAYSEKYLNHPCRWISKVLLGAKGLNFNFMDFATAYGQESYVEEKIRQQQDESQMQFWATRLLEHLLPPLDRYVKSGLPFPSIEMVSMLSKYMAISTDGNGIQHALKLPWGNLIKYICEMPVCSSDSLKEYDPQALYLRYLDILKMLILANNQFGVLSPGSVHAGHGASGTIDLIERFITEKYSKYADRVVRQLRSLEIVGLKGEGSKRSRDCESDDSTPSQRPKRVAMGSDYPCWDLSSVG